MMNAYEILCTGGIGGMAFDFLAVGWYKGEPAHVGSWTLRAC